MKKPVKDIFLLLFGLGALSLMIISLYTDWPHPMPLLSWTQIMYAVAIWIFASNIVYIAESGNKELITSKFGRWCDVVIIFVVLGAAVKDFVHRHDQNVTTFNVLLLTCAILSIIKSEDVRDIYLAKSTMSEQPATAKRGLGESPIVEK